MNAWQPLPQNPISTKASIETWSLCPAMASGISCAGHLLMNPPAEPQLVWLGHASFLFQYRGLNVLTDEPMDEPPRRLRLALERQGMSESAFRVMQHGEVWSPR